MKTCDMKFNKVNFYGQIYGNGYAYYCLLYTCHASKALLVVALNGETWIKFSTKSIC